VLPRALVIDGADTRCCKQHIAPLYGGGLYKPDARNGDMAAAREKNDGAAKTIQDEETGRDIRHRPSLCSQKTTGQLRQAIEMARVSVDVAGMVLPRA